MSELLANFHFIRPAGLLLAPLAVWVWWLWRRRSDPLRGWRGQMDPVLLQALTVGRGGGSGGASVWVLAGWLLAAVAVAGPTWRHEPSSFADDPVPLMILLKADISMDAADPPPSRIERARLKIIDLAEARQGQPLGLIAYAGSAHLVLPPTRDTTIVGQMAAEISPAIMPVPGDRLDLALRKADAVVDGAIASVVVIADSVGTAPSMVSEAWKASDLSVQFLGINAPESDDAASLQTAAEAIRGEVRPLTADDTDVSAILRGAARTLVARSGEDGARWEEAGYMLVPAIALLVVLSFRRQERKEGT
jgi:Ca-activated chloride channel family protein